MTTALRCRHLVAAALLVCGPTISHAASNFTLIDGEGFESPAYDTAFLGTGQLEGQFASTLGGFGSTQWVQSPLAGSGTANVTDAIAASGSQSVEVNRAANSDDRWAVPITGAPSLTRPYVCIEWDMYVEYAGTAQPFGPFFGIEAYDDDATSILRVGSFGVDATTGEILYTPRDDGILPGFLVPTPNGDTVNFNEWNSFRMILDYSTDTYHLFLNDDLLLSTAFEMDGADQFTDADIAAIAAGGDPASQAATGTAYFDNYFVFETDTFDKPVIPEPATVGLIAVAATAALARRKRRDLHYTA